MASAAKGWSLQHVQSRELHPGLHLWPSKKMPVIAWPQAKLQVTLWLLHTPTTHIYPPPKHSLTLPVCTSSLPLLYLTCVQQALPVVRELFAKQPGLYSRAAVVSFWPHFIYAVSRQCYCTSSMVQWARHLHMCVCVHVSPTTIWRKGNFTYACCNLLVATCRPEHHLWAGAPE